MAPSMSNSERPNPADIDVAAVPRAVATPPPIVARPPLVVVHKALAADQPQGWPKLLRRRDPLGRRQWTSSFVASTAFHALLLVLLGWIAASGLRSDHEGPLIVAAMRWQEPSLQAALESETVRRSEDSLDLEDTVRVDKLVDVSAAESGEKAPSPRVEVFATLAEAFSSRDLLVRIERGTSGSLDGRSDVLRQRLVREAGGTPGSEEAVRRGLRWLAAHQRPGGSWHFNHQDGPCRGYCSHPGKVGSTTAATALALLPFLGAGQTHVNGEYQETVRSGLNYLCKRMQQTDLGGDLQEGTMYGQGLATIALCEAYAMTRDQALEPYCREAIRFIVSAQHKEGGGWRYTPREPGDTTVTGWQLMALKSGQLTYMPVPSQTMSDVSRFLDGVQSYDGSNYGYQTSGEEPTTTAIGLLCRMYLGWRRDHPSLVRGVGYLSRRGTSPTDMYYNYYATQVLHHFGGQHWVKWNERMRDYLVATQATEGHESGSWYLPDKHGDSGGRLYNTAMAIMTLEVYYRYMPLYGPRSVDDF